MRLLVSLKCRRSQPPLAMLRAINHSGVMNNVWIGHNGWFLMQPGRVILLLITKVSLICTRSIPMDAGTSSYVYGGGGQYDYDEPGLPDRFSNVVHAADQSLWDGCNQSQLGVVAELVDIKVDGHIFEQMYDRISQWANRILLSDHTLPGDYYSMKKLVKDLGLPVEKIHACKNSCMLYCKDNVDLEYCKFCGDSRYKPARGRDHTGRSSRMQSLEEPRNDLLGFCTDNFSARSVRSYLLMLAGYHYTVQSSPWAVVRHANLTATNNFSLCTIHTEGTTKPSRRIVSRIRGQILSWNPPSSLHTPTTLDKAYDDHASRHSHRLPYPRYSLHMHVTAMIPQVRGLILILSEPGIPVIPTKP
ncbi:UNVERIFIED_CONTAM: hypothetical protein Scaly_2850800 [Sesamum calycinum]|uniref:Uncharacterized protein n=1 Tax=Sesamum calycinum TaxID=2727403 RepID=A0AAW2LH24_9LAMI